MILQSAGYGGEVYQKCEVWGEFKAVSWIRIFLTRDLYILTKCSLLLHATISHKVTLKELAELPHLSQWGWDKKIKREKKPLEREADWLRRRILQRLINDVLLRHRTI